MILNTEVLQRSNSREKLFIEAKKSELAGFLQRGTLSIVLSEEIGTIPIVIPYNFVASNKALRKCRNRSERSTGRWRSSRSRQVENTAQQLYSFRIVFARANYDFHNFKPWFMVFWHKARLYKERQNFPVENIHTTICTRKYDCINPRQTFQNSDTRLNVVLNDVQSACEYQDTVMRYRIRYGYFNSFPNDMSDL